MSTKSQGVQFLNAFSDANSALFLDFLHKHETKSDPFSFGDILQIIPKSDHHSLFQAITQMFTSALNSLGVSTDDDDDNDVDESKTEKGDSKHIFIEVMMGIAVLCQEFIAVKKRHVPASFVELGVLMHGIIFDLQGPQTEQLQAEIVSLCELWWYNGIADKELLTPQTAIYLIINSFNSAKQSDVKRIYRFRHALLLMDFAEQSSSTLKQLLMRCIIHPVFLHSIDGRKFLSFLFGLYVPFIDQLHSAVKNQLVNCRKSLREHYSDIYYRAWRLADGQYLIRIEEHCIQDFINCGVHAINDGTTVAVRHLLSKFFLNKRAAGVDEMLLRLYDPIIWRSLNAANARVRSKAASLFFDAFPLQSSVMSRQELDIILQKQFDQLTDLLHDSDPIVRSTSIKGVCRVLCVFWELVPPQVIKALIGTLVNELAFDATSSMCRAAVFQGLTYLLDNHLSHSILKSVLPHLGCLIHDRSDSVRTACVRLLLAVKDIRSIRYFDIVEVDDLIQRLVLDSQLIQRLICQLLLKSFFPHQERSVNQLPRFISLIKQDYLAAQVFYSQALHYVPLQAICKFIVILHRELLKCGNSCKQKHVKGVRPNKKHKVSNACASIIEGDNIAIEKVLCVMAHVLVSIKSQLLLEKYHALYEFLVDTMQESLPVLFESFPSSTCQNALFAVSSVFPSVVVLETRIMDIILKNLFPINDAFSPLDCLAAWNKLAKVKKHIIQAIKCAISRKSIPDETTIFTAHSCVYYMRHLLKDEPGRRCFLTDLGVLSIFELLPSRVEQAFNENYTLSYESLLIDMIDTFVVVSIHYCSQNQLKNQDAIASSHIDSIFRWSIEVLPTYFTTQEPKQPHQRRSRRGARKKTKASPEHSALTLAQRTLLSVLYGAAEYATLGLVGQLYFAGFTPIWIKAISSSTDSEWTNQCFFLLFKLLLHFTLHRFDLTAIASLLTDLLIHAPRVLFSSSKVTSTLRQIFSIYNHQQAALAVLILGSLAQTSFVKQDLESIEEIPSFVSAVLSPFLLPNALSSLILALNQTLSEETSIVFDESFTMTCVDKCNLVYRITNVLNLLVDRKSPNTQKTVNTAITEVMPVAIMYLDSDQGNKDNEKVQLKGKMKKLQQHVQQLCR